MIIGGGASGVILAAQLLQRASNTQVIIFERTGEIGKGIAYSTGNPSHLLNVRANNMSAFPDRPEHFLNWLQAGQVNCAEQNSSPQSFAPRMLYRTYLNELVANDRSGDAPRLSIIPSGVVAVTMENGKPVVTTEKGERVSADAVIVATGNEAAIATSGKQVSEYWSSNGYFNIDADAPVAIFGTGLSMIDSVLSLLDRGHKGTIRAISRRGLVPARHMNVKPFEIDVEPLLSSRGLATRTHHVRDLMKAAQAQGSDWRSVMDALRPYTQTIWTHLTNEERERFLRHLRPWWDVHRHRMAPQIADRIDAAKASGQLAIIAGRLRAVRNDGEGMVVRYRERHSAKACELPVACIIDCRGGNPAFSRTRNPALQSLMENGLGRPDALDVGLDVTPDLQVIHSRGIASKHIFALGPVTKGTFWEVIAIPDIRVQAARLAEHLIKLSS